MKNSTTFQNFLNTLAQSIWYIAPIALRHWWYQKKITYEDNCNFFTCLLCYHSFFFKKKYMYIVIERNGLRADIYNGSKYQHHMNMVNIRLAHNYPCRQYVRYKVSPFSLWQHYRISSTDVSPLIDTPTSHNS